MNPTPVAFEQFMSQALYNPKNGYYTKNISAIGYKGDFSTTPKLDPILALAIIRWIEQLPTHKNITHLIEVGGGDGSLALSILNKLGLWRRLKITYHLVEQSPHLTKLQQDKLKKYQHKILWHSSMEEALKKSKGSAHIISNELVDAFPVVVLRFDDHQKQWEKLFLQKKENRWEEQFKPIDINVFSEASPLALKEWGTEKYPPHHQRVEIHYSYFQWLKAWISHWKAGHMLTIDYGANHPSLYYRRPQGTLRGYFKHQHLTGSDIYQNPGHQDITTDVNFSDLLHWGEILQVPTQQLLTQRRFILRFCQDLSLKPIKEKHPYYDAMRFLTNKEGAGSAFKVLWQTRSLDDPSKIKIVA